ncbi:MAG: hypothetical protein Q9227_008239 [Pyrenula ochraceoflavens]
MLSAVSSALLGTFFARTGFASPVPADQPDMTLPARYNGSTNGATWLYTEPNRGSYAEVPVQALNGTLIFTTTPPNRVCPCSSEFGADKYTGFYFGGSTEAPTLQLFTSSMGEQTVYVGLDLQLHYTSPGESVPEGANAYSISVAFNDPLGPGFPNGGALDVHGFVTQLNGTQSYYRNLQFCAPAGAPPDAVRGAGPLNIFVVPNTAEDPEANGPVFPGCISSTLFTTYHDPKVGPNTIDFQPPEEPPVQEYS